MGDLLWALAQPLALVLVFVFFFRVFVGVVTRRPKVRGAGGSPALMIVAMTFSVAFRIVGSVLVWLGQRVIGPALGAFGRGGAGAWRSAMNRSARSAPTPPGRRGELDRIRRDDPDGLEDLWRRS